MSTPVPTVVEETVRPIAGFSPTVWGNHFLKSASDFKAIDATTQELYEALKQEVRMMITATADKIADKLHLIDAVQRLGVAYHFEKEIEDELEKILDHLDNDNIGGDDFYTLSLSFRLLRQQGVKISCDVFEKFKNNEGKFKASMINDVQVMLSLYEAAHLAINGEDILDEAIVFTTTHLKSMVSHASPNLAEQINHALKLPLRKALPRLEARYFLDVCSRGDMHDKSLLKFAKLDFNLLQAAHQKEVSDMTRWWIDLDFSTKLAYARDRIVELYFWILMGAYYEPKYAFGRIFMSKLISMISILDDTFDAYGTYDELKLFVEAVKRWDIGAIDTLPEYMKFIYKSLLDVYDKAEESLAKEGRSSYGVKYVKQTMEESIMMYFSEAKWLHEGFLPKIEEYEGVALGSSGVLTLATASFVDMGDIATKEAFEWLIKKPKIVVAAQTIGRLMDDIASHEFEQKRGHIPSAVECYMKQHGVSEEEAKKALRIQVDNAWKDINEELLSPTAVSLPLLERILNLARVCHFMYEDGDRYTQPLLMKDQVALVLKDPVTL
ncbi:alpha-humulene/(-)-(E)-beta-caryophyllene synthase [Citrus sinensis]|uniref:(E)-beta-farnesene synthase-like n=1 Tax=Citrus sinensis TaxID=2711 RepID=UPI000763697A|nr:(E)-beta-farnesene synthase-like [Citrus sinensis]XP_024034159.1 (E)-beta-farnesene synthase-like [Citrus x clementina]KAH9651324.1 alpha-humulene/(-)-(E)-beta-caryophyllene synthase [Citrus sinensis]